MNVIFVQSSLLWITVILILVIGGISLWRKRKLYYYGSKIPGPLSLPLIGNMYMLSGRVEDFYDTFASIVEKQPEIFRFWVGPKLFIFNSRPQDIEILANVFLGKADFYEYVNDFLGDGSFTLPANRWKARRKMINPTFNMQIVNSFIEIFSKYAKVLVENLKSCSEEENLIPIIWRCTLDIACETLTDVDASQITGQDEYIKIIVQAENLTTFRFLHIRYFPNFIWNRSKYYKEMQSINSQTFRFVNKVIAARNLNKPPTTDKTENKIRFLNYFHNLKEDNDTITDKDVIDETHTLLTTGSETLAILLSLVFLTLSIHKDVQEKTYEELYSIFGNSGRDPTLEDINSMDYLERVIKETLRVLTPTPLIGRHVDKEVKINSVVYPEGSTLIFPVLRLNRNSEFWRDPLKFDPDRFLPEEMKKKHRCTFIPFSFGQRSCIGFRFGMLSVKVLLSTVLRYYEISSSKYKSVDEIKMYYHVVAKPKDGCHVVLTRRK